METDDTAGIDLGYCQRNWWLCRKSNHSLDLRNFGASSEILKTLTVCCTVARDQIVMLQVERSSSREILRTPSWESYMTKRFPIRRRWLLVLVAVAVVYFTLAYILLPA